MRDAFRLVCERDPGCSALGGDVIDRLEALANALRADPLAGQAYDGDGVVRDVEIDASFLSYLAGAATYGTTVYEELDGAGRAWLERDDPAPLLRIAAEQTDWSEVGDPAVFSYGLYVAVVCNDYPQLWDIAAPFDARPAQFAASVADLRANDSDAFAPFTVDDWLASPWTEYESCIKWPAPDPWVPPVDSPATYPAVPTLVLVGDLDSITSSEGSRIVADRFPNSTFVQVANTGHVTALVDHSRCTSNIVVEFVRTESPGDTSCASQYQEVRTTDEFALRLSDVATPSGSASARQLRVASTVTSTVGDVFPRWFAMLGSEGVGLRGGTFTTTGLDAGGDRRSALLGRGDDHSTIPVGNSLASDRAGDRVAQLGDLRDEAVLVVDLLADLDQVGPCDQHCGCRDRLGPGLHVAARVAGLHSDARRVGESFRLSRAGTGLDPDPARREGHHPDGRGNRRAVAAVGGEQDVLLVPQRHR